MSFLISADVDGARAPLSHTWVHAGLTWIGGNFTAGASNWHWMCVCVCVFICVCDWTNWFVGSELAADDEAIWALTRLWNVFSQRSETATRDKNTVRLCVRVCSAVLNLKFSHSLSMSAASFIPVVFSLWCRPTKTNLFCIFLSSRPPPLENRENSWYRILRLSLNSTLTALHCR